MNVYESLWIDCLERRVNAHKAALGKVIDKYIYKINNKMKNAGSIAEVFFNVILMPGNPIEERLPMQAEVHVIIKKAKLVNKLQLIVDGCPKVNVDFSGGKGGQVKK
eukprot:14520706-Ditylum_brightwellii.AAC.1